MNEIQFRSLDLCIKQTDNGKEYVAIKASVAFDEGFVEFCRVSGVRDFVPYEAKKDTQAENRFDDED